MSAIDLVGDVGAPYALIYSYSRSIGTIIPDITLEEIHRDETIITDHPVETGAAISDHAFNKPVELTMRVGWSDSSAQSPGWVQQVYEQIRSLKDEREPFDVSTGKRQYSNMLIRAISVTTDNTSEYALNAVIDLREILITNTEQGSSTQANQKNPSETSPNVSRGSQSPSVVSGSNAAANFGSYGAANPEILS